MSLESRRYVDMKTIAEKTASGRKLRIAVIKTDGIGDAVLASPFLFELRKFFKNAEITGFLSPAGKEVLDNQGIFDTITVIDPLWLKYKKVFFIKRIASAMKLLSAVNKAKPDILISLRYQDRLTSLVTSLAQAKEKTGYNVLGMGFGINNKVIPLPPGTHVIEKNLNVLKYLGIKLKAPAKTGFSLSKSAVSNVRAILKKSRIKKYIVVHPVSGHLSKDWAPEKYKDLIKFLSRRHKIVIAGSASDNRIKEYGGKNVYNLAGRLSIKELGALIKTAAMVIGNDSAAVHIGAAFGVKTLTIFSGTCDYREWGAGGRKSYIIRKPVECENCGLLKCNKKMHECMEIPPEFAADTVNKIFSGKQKQRVIIHK